MCTSLELEKLMKSIRNAPAPQATPSAIRRNFKEVHFGSVKGKNFLLVAGLWPWEGFPWGGVPDSPCRCAFQVRRKLMHELAWVSGSHVRV